MIFFGNCDKMKYNKYKKGGERSDYLCKNDVSLEKDSSCKRSNCSKLPKCFHNENNVGGETLCINRVFMPGRAKEHYVAENI